MFCCFGNPLGCQFCKCYYPPCGCLYRDKLMETLQLLLKVYRKQLEEQKKSKTLHYQKQ